MIAKKIYQFTEQSVNMNESELKEVYDSGLVFGHNLHQDDKWLALSGGGYGLVQQIYSFLAIIQYFGYCILCKRTASSFGNGKA